MSGTANRGASASADPASASAGRRPPSRGDAVPSPCVSVCRIDPANGLCEGCLRTLDEIARWGQMNNEARRSVWKAIDARRERRNPCAGAQASLPCAQRPDAHS